MTVLCPMQSELLTLECEMEMLQLFVTLSESSVQKNGELPYRCFGVSSPDCTLHTAVNHVVTVLEWQVLVCLHVVENHVKH